MTNTIGKRITQLREEQKLTRYRLAKESEVSFSYLCALEDEKHSPSLDIILKISSGLGVPVNKLLSE
ncbi:helix-turn-helix domain-containing protein [Alkalihalobacillus sp. LMS6]|uniref:helix-turn-helix transcriptional regulator n=1 Tax=Alkalihalobacillus sp. LMS6 TaxID=2924034 RepID=UPI0020D16875|nr:helix-turn-helix transcriptional regulator [Alkalihalobacillus sp. LMS6]UTR05429.1 helix-turn-helix domain-containing protein [Alkalihalobacillus sp. LMS6]